MDFKDVTDLAVFGTTDPNVANRKESYHASTVLLLEWGVVTATVIQAPISEVVLGMLAATPILAEAIRAVKRTVPL